MDVEETKAYLAGLAEQSIQAETHVDVAGMAQEAIKGELEPYATAIGGLLEDSKSKLSEIEAMSVNNVQGMLGGIKDDVQQAFHIMWGLRTEVGTVPSVAELEGHPVQNVSLLESIREKWTQAQRILHDPAASQLGRDEDMQVQRQTANANRELYNVDGYLEEAATAYQTAIEALGNAQTALRSSYDHIGTSQDLLTTTKEQIDRGRSDLLYYIGTL